MEHLLYLGTLIAVWVIVALAANLVIGYTGMMAMGQAAYLGVGGYVIGILAKEGVTSGFLQWPVVLAVSAASK